MHLAAALAIVIAGVEAKTAILIFLCLSLSLVSGWRLHAARTHRRSVKRLVLKADGCCVLELVGGATVNLRLLRRACLFRRFMVLSFATGHGFRPRQYLPIPADSLPGDTYRRLRVCVLTLVAEHAAST